MHDDTSRPGAAGRRTLLPNLGLARGASTAIASIAMHCVMEAVAPGMFAYSSAAPGVG